MKVREGAHRPEGHREGGGEEEEGRREDEGRREGEGPRVYIYIYICICVYIYIEREREGERQRVCICIYIYIYTEKEKVLDGSFAAFSEAQCPDTPPSVLGVGSRSWSIHPPCPPRIQKTKQRNTKKLQTRKHKQEGRRPPASEKRITCMYVYIYIYIYIYTYICTYGRR